MSGKYLRQSTASQTRTIGPFVDDTDFKTAEDALTINASDIRLKKNGAADVAKNSGGGTADVNGQYAVTWDATDTDTVGELHYSVKVAGALQVFGSYTVLEEAVYDILFAASATGAVPVASIAANAITAAAIATGAIDADAIADNAIDAGAIASDAITAAKIATGAITAAKFAAGAIDAAAIAADAIGASELAADAIAEIADAVWDEDATAHQTQGTFGQAIGDPAADTNTIFAAVVTNASGATVGHDTTAILEDTGTTLQAELDGIQADTEDIQSRLPAALVSGRIDASVGAMAANVITAAATAADYITEVQTAITGGAYDLDTDANGRIRIVDGTGTGEIDTVSGKVLALGTGGAALALGSEIAALNNLSAAQVNSEVDTALADIHLDHLIAVADPGGVVANSSFLAKLVSKSATPAFSSFDNTTDSLEALQAEHDTTQAAIAALNNITAASVWAVGTRTLTAGTNIDGSTFTAIPWNASWDAEVQSEVIDALQETVPDSVPSDGTRPSVQQALYMILQAMIEGSISGTSWTVKKVDGSTTLFTVTLDSSTTPTSKTRSG